MQRKLDEVIRSVNDAHNARLDLEQLAERDLETPSSTAHARSGRATGGRRNGQTGRG